MPELKIKEFSDELLLENYLTIFSTMLFPQDEDIRESFKAIAGPVFLDNILPGMAKDSEPKGLDGFINQLKEYFRNTNNYAPIINSDWDSKKHFDALKNSPSQDEMLEKIKLGFIRGMQAGNILISIIKMNEDPCYKEKGSVRKAIFLSNKTNAKIKTAISDLDISSKLIEKYSGPLLESESKSRETIWSKYKSVAPFWAALCICATYIEKRPPGFAEFGLDLELALKVFCELMESYQWLMKAHDDLEGKRGRMLEEDELWIFPERLNIQRGDVLNIPLMKSELEILKKYKAH